MPRHARTLDFPLHLEAHTAQALAAALVEAIRTGLLADGDWLPSTRALAGQLGCSRTLAISGYDRLLAAGFVEGVPASGTRVCAGAARAARAGLVPTVGTGGSHLPTTDGEAAPPAATDAPRAKAGPPTAPPAIGPTAVPAPPADRAPTSVDLTPGQPDVALLRHPAWRAAWRRAADAMSAYPPWEATTPLSTQLAAHLRTNRGIADAQPLLLPGTVPAARLLRQALPELPALVESPCYGEMFRELDCGLAGLDFVPVDADGLVVAALPNHAALLYTTPAHQYPLGHRMSVQRRRELVDWARRTGSLIIEDDYDGEFRYGVAPLPALRSIPGAEDHVAYLGTASKILAPDLRVAWLDVPARLRPAVEREAQTARLAVPGIVGRALADFMSSGGLRKHLARASRAYRERRSVLLAALAAQCPGRRVLGVDAGLHVTMELPATNDEAVAAQLHTRGYRVAPLSRYPAQRPRAGLVIGYARADYGQLRGCARELGQVLDSQRPDSQGAG